MGAKIIKTFNGKAKREAEYCEIKSPKPPVRGAAAGFCALSEKRVLLTPVDDALSGKKALLTPVDDALSGKKALSTPVNSAFSGKRVLSTPVDDALSGKRAPSTRFSSAHSSNPLLDFALAGRTGPIPS